MEVDCDGVLDAVTCCSDGDRVDVIEISGAAASERADRSQR